MLPVIESPSPQVESSLPRPPTCQVNTTAGSDAGAQASDETSPTKEKGSQRRLFVDSVDRQSVNLTDDASMTKATAEVQVLRYLQRREANKSVSAAIVTTLDAPAEGFGGDWWGGALSPDKCIYYVPKGANQVLKFDPASGARELIGPELMTGASKGMDFKWMGGVLGEDGNIYGIPCNAERVLRINPKTQEVDMIGTPLPRGQMKVCCGR